MKKSSIPLAVWLSIASSGSAVAQSAEQCKDTLRESVTCRPFTYAFKEESDVYHSYPRAKRTGYTVCGAALDFEVYLRYMHVASLINVQSSKATNCSPSAPNVFLSGWGDIWDERDIEDLIPSFEKGACSIYEIQDDGETQSVFSYYDPGNLQNAKFCQLATVAIFIGLPYFTDVLLGGDEEAIDDFLAIELAGELYSWRTFYVVASESGKGNVSIDKFINDMPGALSCQLAGTIGKLCDE